MTEIEWMNAFGDNLMRMLKNEGMTQKDLADKTELSEATISRYIARDRTPSLKAIINIAYAFDCSTDDLIDFGEMIE